MRVNCLAASVAVLGAMTASSRAGSSALVTIEFLPPGYTLTSLSADGTAGAGNVTEDLSYETFRWTASGGVQRLGLATAPVIGTGAGTPDISYDGERISATILSTDTHMTQGVWTLGSGWVETMLPIPANGVLFDNAYGSAWGLSGDGQTLTGFYWGTTATSTRARACIWTASTGVVALPQLNDRDSRASAANGDGSVVVGWESRTGGAWRPVVWRDGVQITLQDTQAFCTAEGVSTDGSVVVGSGYVEETFSRVAARWVWNGTSYDMTQFAQLPGTHPIQGEAKLVAVSGDGSLAVGWNRYQGGLNSPIDCLVWTASGGLVKLTDFLAANGLTSQLPADLVIRSMSAVSQDGSAFTGSGTLTQSGQTLSFIIRFAPPPPCMGDADGSESVNFADVTSVLVNFNGSGPAGDADHDGDVDFADITSVLVNFNSPC